MIKDYKAYNGWTNYATWNVALWVNNTEHIYHSMCRCKPFTVESLKALVECYFPHGTPDLEDEPNWEDDVDWDALVDSFNEEE